MPRSKDTKIWNEDLTLAFTARAQQALVDEKCSTVGWTKAAQAIQAVRKDIYKANTGRIYNLPEKKLGKNALTLAYKIMDGTTAILPDGHIPRSQEQEEKVGHEKSWDNYPFLKKIKMRGGAYAILMAFHYSTTKTLSKGEICLLAQPYCDEDMDGNFHAGRMYGAWAAHKTLLTHNLLVAEGNNCRYVHGVGFRSNGSTRFTLTRDGELFTEAMIRKFDGGVARMGATSKACSDGKPALISPFASTPPYRTIHLPSRCSPALDFQKLNSPAKRPFSGSGCILSTVSPDKKIRPAFAAGTAALTRAAIEESKRSPGVAPRCLFSKIDDVLGTTTCEVLAPTHSKLFEPSTMFVLEDSDDDIPSPSGFTMEKDDVNRKQCLDTPCIINLLVDSEHNIGKCTNPRSEGTRKNEKRSDSTEYEAVVDLSCEEPPWNRAQREVTREVICLDSDDEIKPSPKTKVIANPYKKASHRITICIDDRERVRNAAPRRLRTELNRLLENGCLSSLLPRELFDFTVNEVQLRYGDFSYLLGESRLDVAVERKQMRDLVQRSTKGDHWNQLATMRDNFNHAIFLIEGDPREAARFTAHGSQDLENWNAYDTVINDEKSFYFFMCRALLSHRSVKFLQTREFQSTLRAVGALGLMAATLKIEMQQDPERRGRSVDHRAYLVKRFTDAGIPTSLCDRIAGEFISAMYLESVYKECVDEDCKKRLLLPVVECVDPESIGPGSSLSWSEAVYRSFFSVHSDVTIAQKSYQKFQPLVTDHGELLCALHKELDCDMALDSLLAGSKKIYKSSCRKVTVELCESQSTLLPKPTADSFLALKCFSTQPFGADLPTMVFRTTSGPFCSPNIKVHIVPGSYVVSEAKAALLVCNNEFVKAAKSAALSLVKGCVSKANCTNVCRTIVIVKGLSSAIEADAKVPGYRRELKPLLDLIISNLMLEHDIVVIQALRQNGDVEIFLEQLTLACFHFQRLTRKSS